jgi:hypothetical protein
MKHFTNYRKLTAAKVAALIFTLTMTSHVFSQNKENAIHIGFVYPISNHGTQANEYTNVFSLHALAGLSHGEKGATIAGITNVITGDASGCQIAGISNHIGGFADGFKVAGLLNTYDRGRGFQLAGFANIAKSNVSGMQMAGFINTAHDRKGFQIAGFTNIAANVNGQQLAGFINTAEDVKGTQIAGFINVAKNVKGVQLAGFINIADSSDFPIGIINIIKTGEQTLGVSVDDNLTTLLAFRSGGKKMYGIIGLGQNLKNTKDIYSIQFGLGAHLISTNSFRLNTEATTVMLENFKKGSFTKYSLALLPAVKLSPRFEIFGGPALNLINTDTAEGKDLVNHYVWTHTSNHNHLSGVYVGYTAGIHMRL